MSAGLLLDTVAVSELRKGPKGDAQFRQWHQSTVEVPVFISVITLVEVRRGILQVAKRDPSFAGRLEAWYQDFLLPKFERTLLPVDAVVAHRAAELHALRTYSDHDALIAATALVHGLRLATRNEADFDGTGVTVVNPWKP
jgi:toxin FitB